jgi:hypothetical protein
MTFHVLHQPSPNKARCPFRVVERTTGREIDWINRYLDYECLRRLSDVTLRSYAHELLQKPELTGAIINHRVAIVDKALRIVFPNAPAQVAPGFQKTYWQRAPLDLGRPMPALSRLRVKTQARHRAFVRGTSSVLLV